MGSHGPAPNQKPSSSQTLTKTPKINRRRLRISLQLPALPNNKPAVSTKRQSDIPLRQESRVPNKIRNENHAKNTHRRQKKKKKENRRYEPEAEKRTALDFLLRNQISKKKRTNRRRRRISSLSLSSLFPSLQQVILILFLLLGFPNIVIYLLPSSSFSSLPSSVSLSRIFSLSLSI